MSGCVAIQFGFVADKLRHAGNLGHPPGRFSAESYERIAILKGRLHRSIPELDEPLDREVLDGQERILRGAHHELGAGHIALRVVDLLVELCRLGGADSDDALAASGETVAQVGQQNMVTFVVTEVERTNMTTGSDFQARYVTERRVVHH